MIDSTPTHTKTQVEEIQPIGYLNPVVERIGAMHFEGNLIPHTWYQMPLLQMQNGKPNLVAIILLSDIVYWYRPTVIRDEASGYVVEVRQKFSYYRLYKNYRKWGAGFGFTLRQVEDAMAFLKKSGIVDVERKTIATNFNVLPNCAFIEPNIDLLEIISSPVKSEKQASASGVAVRHGATGEVSRYNGRPAPDQESPVIKQTISRYNGTTLPLKRETITKIKYKEKNSKTNQQTNLLSQIPTRTCVHAREGAHAHAEAEAAPVAEAGLVGLLVSDESSFSKASEAVSSTQSRSPAVHLRREKIASNENPLPQIAVIQEQVSDSEDAADKDAGIQHTGLQPVAEAVSSEDAPMGDIVAGLVATGMPLAEAEGRLAQHGDASCQLLLERRQRLQKRWKNSKGAEAAKTPTAAPTASNSALVASAPEPQPPPVPEPVPEMDVTQELQSFGISPARVAQLIETHGEARCRQAVLQVPEYANAVRQGRWIVKALAEGWTFGKPAREWKLNDAKDLPLLVEAHGLNAVCAEMLRRADQLERKGDLPTARRRRRIVALLRQGLPGDQAIAQAREEQLALPR
jgi:hypothetical protein